MRGAGGVWGLTVICGFNVLGEISLGKCNFAKTKSCLAMNSEKSRVKI